jgi:hypothetical protein
MAVQRVKAGSLGVYDNFSHKEVLSCVPYFTQRLQPSRYGSRQRAYRAIDNHVYDRVRHFLARRHKVHGRGTRQFSHERVFGDLGVLRLYRVRSAAPPCASR